jgi:hypothetical protein
VSETLDRLGLARYGAAWGEQASEALACLHYRVEMSMRDVHDRLALVDILECRGPGVVPGQQVPH